ncbi:MAG: aldo/keto reductase [Chloroflexi bacterium]|nr:aldo/keto reductase [Chloroflexota bacterium]MCL5274929.1 aldo/keto reductase [Chloroflexota bacterium]
MKYRAFGRLGWQVSEIGFGAWAIGGGWGAQSNADSLAALHRALDLGCNFIDTAAGYGNGRSERLIGQVLKERTGQRIYVATKIPPAPGNWPPSPYDRIEERYSEPYLCAQLEERLRNLGVECVDLIQLHTWTRAWNRDPLALDILRKFQKEGKLLGIGISTPEHDQNSLIDLMRNGWLDVVQVIYNIFEQEPQAEFLPAAHEHKVGVIVRVAFDEGALTGKWTPDTKFESDDFRNNYFAGDRLARAVARVAKVKETLGQDEPNLPAAALKFALKPAAVSTVIPGMRNVRQAEMNCGVSDLPPMSDAVEARLRPHNWLRGFWYGGK